MFMRVLKQKTKDNLLWPAEQAKHLLVIGYIKK